jgi:hypothetical protein
MVDERHAMCNFFFVSLNFFVVAYITYMGFNQYEALAKDSDGIVLFFLFF